MVEQSMTRVSTLSRFYRAIEQLGAPRPLKDINLATLPLRGVYFFFEEGELRRESGTGLRVVRVGTHALTLGSKSTLAQRLRQHRGSPRGGNHRGSIFRLLVGQALLEKAISLPCPSWGVKGQFKHAAGQFTVSASELRAAEKIVEVEVSRILGQMRVTILECDDEPGPDSLRSYFERNSIALLSSAQRSGLDIASDDWLGRHSNRGLVRRSGLWNQRHTDERAELELIEKLEATVRAGLRH